jgi:hypothetical protein
MNISKALFATAFLTFSGAALAGGDLKPKHGGVEKSEATLAPAGENKFEARARST